MYSYSHTDMVTFRLNGHCGLVLFIEWYVSENVFNVMTLD